MAAFVTPDPGKPHMEIAAVQVFKITVMTYVRQKPKQDAYMPSHNRSSSSK